MHRKGTMLRLHLGILLRSHRSQLSARLRCNRPLWRTAYVGRAQCRFSGIELPRPRSFAPNAKGLSGSENLRTIAAPLRTIARAGTEAMLLLYPSAPSNPRWPPAMRQAQEFSSLPLLVVL